MDVMAVNNESQHDRPAEWSSRSRHTFAAAGCEAGIFTSREADT
jgi:hypothetical protein